MVLNVIGLRMPGLSLEEKVSLQYRQLALMAGAGMDMDEALDTLIDESIDKKTSQFLEDLKLRIAQADSIKKLQKKSVTYCNDALLLLMKTNPDPEALAAFLNSSADELENSAALVRKFINSLIYPFYVLIIAFVVLAFIMTFVLPAFEEMYAGISGSLPAPTRLTLSMAHLIVENGYWLLGAIVIGIIIAKKSKKRILNLASHLPGFSLVLKTISLVQFTRTLSIMTSIQLPLKDAVKVASLSVDNDRFSKKLKPIADSMDRNVGFRDSLATSGLFSKMVLQVAAVGERMQMTAPVFSRVSIYYEKQMDSILTRFSTMINVVFILAIGTVVGWLVIAMYLPIFQMAGVI